MLDFIYPVILIVCLLSILWLFLKPKKAHEVHYLIHKNKQKILDISKAYDLYAEASHLVIAQFSDTHFGRRRKPHLINPLIRSTIVRQPDVIVATGDFIDDYARWPHRQTHLLTEKLKRFNAPLGTFAVLGNQDYVNNGQYFVKEVLKEGQFTPLINEETFVIREDVSLRIVGLDDTLVGKPMYDFEKKIATWQVLLVHEAHHVERVANLTDYDLILTGHPVKPGTEQSKDVSVKFTHGLYQIGKKTLLSIYPGLMNRRFFAPKPMIYYYHLAPETKKKNTD